MSVKLRKKLRRILFAAVIFFTLMAREKMGDAPALENRWVNLGLYAIPYLICGIDILKKAVLGILHGQMFDESFLMALASVGAFATGQNEEAAAVMLFYQVGEWFQDCAVDRSRTSITELMDIAPEFANIERADGSVETAEPDDVRLGDILVIRPGERIPVDAEVISGESLVNTAALTGEAVPRSAGPGDGVISGCVNGEGLLRVRALKTYEDSTVAKIFELVETASEKKSRTEAFITRFARYYTPIVVFSALALAVVPSLVTGRWLDWVYRACTFLVISCPCALVISVPLAFFGGVGAASRSGVLVKGSNYLELLAGLGTVVTDKTGTLTEGNFKVSKLLPAEGVSREVLLENAALAEGLSTHPIAASIREAYEAERPGAKLNMNRVTGTENAAGRGISATVDGARILVGNELLMRENKVTAADGGDGAATVCHVARDGRFLGAILIRDAVKAGAREAVAAMRRAGVKRVVMLTGDRRRVAEAVGRELAVDEVAAELLPKDKVAKVEELLLESEREGGTLAFIGDGINDAPVLMRADVGIAMGSLGSDAAIEAADVVIMDDDLARIPAVIRIARRTLAVSRQNIVFALAVKVLILILGALGLANMWAAVFADVGVAMLCILNSMRLIAVKKTI